MHSRVVAALLAALCACGLLLGVGVGVGTDPVEAAGSASLLPTNSPCNATGPCRPAIEWRTSGYGPVAAGETQIRRRTLWSVFARAGETILTGSSSVGLDVRLSSTGATVPGHGDVVIWDPGVITDTESPSLPALVPGSNGFSCLAQRAAGGDPEQGRIRTRGQERAGPRAVDGSGSAGGYTPCAYVAPVTGIYRVAFYGTAGGASNAQSTLWGEVGSSDGHVFPTITNGSDGNGYSTAVEAWDITVREGGATDTGSVPGRLFTYVFTGSTGNNGRGVDLRFRLTTSDGYRYSVDTKAFDPNGFVVYGNSVGFLDTNGLPLYRDVVAAPVAGVNPSFLPALQGGTHLAPPEYPLSLEPLAPETMTALGIPLSPVVPDIAGLTFTGQAAGNESYVGRGGTFTLENATAGTYQIVISRDGVDFDPRKAANRVLRGVVEAGSSAVAWDGLDNVRVAFPAGAAYAARVTMQAGSYHAPMIDVEGSANGGPAIILTNPPAGVCPFTGVVSDGTNCGQAFYDDRGYLTAGGVQVGTTVGGGLCPHYDTAPPPRPLSSDPATGYDSRGLDRRYTTAVSCAPGTSLGDARGLDLWSWFPSATQSASAQVVPLPAAPDAVDDALTVPAGTGLTAGLLGNDGGTRPTVTASTAPAHGSATVAPGGTLTYTPEPGWSGADTLTYTVTDDAGQADTATVRVRVIPVAGDDELTVPAGVTTTVPAGELLAGDVGDGLTVTAVGTPAHGSAVLAGGVVAYTPAPGFSGTDAVGYTVADAGHGGDGGGSDTGTVTVTVLPGAVDDDLAVRSDVPTTTPDGALVGNDLGTGLRVTGWTQPQHGSVSVTPTGRLTVTPAPGWTGADGFTYTVADAAGRTGTGSVRLTLVPTGGVDALVMRAGTTLTVPDGVLRGDDPGATRSVTAAVPTTPPGHGGVTVSGGVLAFVPAPGFSGVEDLTYTVTGPGGTTTLLPLRISVLPYAVDDDVAGVAGAPVPVTTAALLDNDLGVGLVFAGTTQPGHGSVAPAGPGALTYTPQAGWSGRDSFHYTVADGRAATSAATVTVAVPPTAAADVHALPAGGAVDVPAPGVLANDGGTGLRVVGVGTPEHGTATLASDGRLRYTADAGWSGPDTLTYTLADAAGQTATATVTLAAAPVAGDDAATLGAGTPLVRSHAELLANDVGTALRVTSVDTPSHGSAVLSAGTLIVTPPAGWSGTLAVGTVVTDAAGTTARSVLTVVVTPTAGDDGVVLRGTDVVSLPGNQQLLGNDLGSALTVTGWTPTTRGTATVTPAGALTYTPAPGSSGTDATTYTVVDAEGRTATGTVTITVLPRAVRDDLAVLPERTRTWPAGVLLGNDVGSGLRVQSATAPAHGTATVLPDGTLTYRGDTGFLGTDSFTYRLVDAAGRTDATSVTVDVGPVLPPTAGDDTAAVDAGAVLTLAGADLLANDTGSGTAVTAVIAPGHGTAVVGPGGAVTYTPDAGWSGDDAFGYTVTDRVGQEATGTVQVVVRPVAVDDARDAVAETVLVTELLGNDRGTALQVTAHDTGAHGTAAVTPGGTLTYTPEDGWSGVDTLTYTVTDAAARTATAAVTLTVRPDARTDVLVLLAGTTLDLPGGALLGNDVGTGLTVTTSSAPDAGTATVAPDGAFGYEPAAGSSGTDDLTYTVTDAGGLTAVGAVELSVLPEAVDGALTLRAGSRVTVSGSALVAGSTGTDLRLVAAGPAAHGTATVGADGSLAYEPDAGWSGPDAVELTLADADGLTTTTDLLLTVLPDALDDSATVRSGEVLTVPAGVLLAGDRGAGLAVSTVTADGPGTAELTADGGLLFRPADGASGPAAVGYTVTDAAGGVDAAVLSVAVTPVAVDDRLTTDAGTPLQLSAADGLLTGDRGTALTVVATTAPARGAGVVDPDGALRYAPAPGATGPDAFTYTARDAAGQLAVGTVTVEVLATQPPVSPPPPPGDLPPTAVPPTAVPPADGPPADGPPADGPPADGPPAAPAPDASPAPDGAPAPAGPRTPVPLLAGPEADPAASALAAPADEPAALPATPAARPADAGPEAVLDDHLEQVVLSFVLLLTGLLLGLLLLARSRAAGRRRVTTADRAALAAGPAGES